MFSVFYFKLNNIMLGFLQKKISVKRQVIQTQFQEIFLCTLRIVFMYYFETLQFGNYIV